MKIYNFHSKSGVFLGSSDADESPLEPGVFLVPANATVNAPPAVADGQQALWRDGAWIVEPIPEPEPEPQPEPIPALLTWDDVRTHRNMLLAQCDWTQISDAPLSPEQKSAWRGYRQALRDITETYETPEAVVWPSQPTE